MKSFFFFLEWWSCEGRLEDISQDFCDVTRMKAPEYWVISCVPNFNALIALYLCIAFVFHSSSSHLARFFMHKLIFHNVENFMERQNAENWMQIFKVLIPWFPSLWHWKRPGSTGELLSRKINQGKQVSTDRDSSCRLTNNWTVPYSSLPWRHN